LVAEGLEALGCAEEESCLHDFAIGVESLARGVWIVLSRKHWESLAGVV